MLYLLDTGFCSNPYYSGERGIIPHLTETWETCLVSVFSMGTLFSLGPDCLFFFFKLYFFFLPCQVNCGILVPLLGIESDALTLRAWHPNHWTTREFPKLYFGIILDLQRSCLVIQRAPLYPSPGSLNITILCNQGVLLKTKQ